ncbi:hypothetical protein [Qipengyuania marisflavi]|uniref:Uncharacterized protein n=1 Tax=Qipengyuania marisflavi TaxID=2486356 RepID=A0A5S3PDY9_9SPHN|nr:hypothetical protein [Qipengyuania marisflavi]TMM49770.1 hypothetical protein FEV51_00785 [Qipengyuania marisflavi]
MKIALAVGTIAAGIAVPAIAQDEVERDLRDRPAACVPGQVIIPPFNNTPEAMDQSRYAATVVMGERARSGERSVNVCQTSAVAPEISELKHGPETPIDPEYDPELDDLPDDAPPSDAPVSTDAG